MGRKIGIPTWQLSLFSFAKSISKRKKQKRWKPHALLKGDITVQLCSFLNAKDTIQLGLSCHQLLKIIFSFDGRSSCIWNVVDTRKLLAHSTKHSETGLISTFQCWSKTLFRCCQTLYIAEVALLTNAMLELIGSSCSNLRDLRIEGEHLFIPTRLGYGLLTVLNNCSQLRSLELAAVVSPRILKGLPQKCTQLRKIVLKPPVKHPYDASQKNPKTISRGGTGGVIVIVGSGGNAVTVHAGATNPAAGPSGDHDDHDNESDNENQTCLEHIHLVGQCKMLVHVDISHPIGCNRNLDDRALRPLFQVSSAVASASSEATSNLPLLQTLDLSGSACSDLTLKAVGDHCPVLRQFRCRRACPTYPRVITLDGTKRLLSQHRGLERLVVGNVQKSTVELAFEHMPNVKVKVQGAFTLGTELEHQFTFVDHLGVSVACFQLENKKVAVFLQHGNDEEFECAALK
jgi:hypothetical protein